MGFEEFKKTLVDWLNERYDATFECHEVVKNNGLHLTGITGHREGESISPNIYIDDIYNSVKNGMSFGAAATIVETKYKQAIAVGSWKIPNFFDIEQVKDKIVARLVNLPRNEELLRQVPHKEVANDLAVTYRYLHSKSDVEVASALIDNEMLQHWNLSKEELHTLALKNTERIFPAKIDSLADIIYKIMSKKIQEEIPEPFRETALTDLREEVEAVGENQMYIITNDVGVNGAIAILYPSVQEQITQKFGDNAYLLPSSIHEMMVVSFKEEIDKEFLTEMVKEANCTAVGLEDLLSDSVYQLKNRELVNANEFDHTIEKMIEEAMEEIPEDDLGLEP